MDKKELEDKIEELHAKALHLIVVRALKECKKVNAVWAEFVNQVGKIEELEEQINKLTIKELEALAATKDRPIGLFVK